jgi:anti-anti-sigma factor
MADFEHRLERLATHVLLTLKGQLSMESVPDFDRLLDDIPTTSKWVVVDLADVAFLGSPAIAALVLLQRRAAANEARVALVGAQPPIARVLELAGVRLVMTIANSVEEVLSAPSS